MGLYADGELIWGVPITAYDGDAGPTVFWNEDDEDWRKFDGLKTVQFGHYEDPELHAILTTESIPSFSGDCWDPTCVPDRALDVEAYHQDAADEFVERLVEIDESLVEKRGWWLVASYG